jgi:FkbM family methyltransferase
VNLIKNLIVLGIRKLGYSLRTISASSVADEEWQSLNLRRVSMQLLAHSPLTRGILLSQAEKIASGAKSQLGQDVLALSVHGLSDKGFFVEFGATDGLNLSNTFLLEKDFGWVGILCEPAKVWHSDLSSNRSCSIDTRCVSSHSDRLVDFAEAPDAKFSTISEFRDQDSHLSSRKDSSIYQVKTVSLRDLLLTHNAPAQVNFLSIDTEGSEYLILEDFDFTEYKFDLICVEHNHTSNQERIFQLLTANGYKRIHTELSQWDDWYVDVENLDFRASSESSNVAYV